MDWIDSTGDTVEPASALRQPFEVLKPVPTQATARVQKVQTGKGKDKHQTVLQENLLHAFPEAFPGETLEQRILRQQAYNCCWSAISQNLEAVLEATNYATFQALLQFAASAHQIPATSSSFVQRSRIIPAALTFAGGVNSADHARTFPTLVSLLRQQGCFAAILQPSHLPTGKGVSTAINSVLCQYSGLETDADDMLALLAWYQDVLTAPEGTRVSPPKPPCTPFGKLQLTTPLKTTRATATAAAARGATSKEDGSPAVSPGGVVVSPLARLGINTPTAKSKGPSQANGAQARQQGLTAAERPLVVVIEEAEAVDTLTLQNLILVLSEVHAELPIILILGMATSAGALQQMLPVAAASMLQPQHFQLASSMERFETLVREVLLGGSFTGVFFGHHVMRFINHQFMTHDFTTAVLRKGLQVACIAHFQQTPLSYLAAEIASLPDQQEIIKLIEQLPDSQIPFLRQQILKTSPAEAPCTSSKFDQQVLAELSRTCKAWSMWAVVLRWINLAACTCDGSKPRLIHTLRVLYLDASSTKYANSMDKKQMLDHLCTSVARLSIDQCIIVLQGLSTCADEVWNGQTAMHDGILQTQSLLAELKAGSPTKENQPQGQQPPAPAPGSKPPTALGPSKPVLAPSRRNAQLSSSANRQAAMRQQLETAKAKAKEAQQAKAAVSWQMSMAAKVANLLRCIVDKALETPPAATPGAAILCCGKAAAAELQCLTAAPRLAVHEALSAPHKYLGTPYQISLSSKSDDACIAYQLFLEYGESVDVADWFSSFCAVHDSSDGTPEDEQQAASISKPKKRRGRPSKKVLQKDEPGAPSTSAAAAASKAGSTAGRPIKATSAQAAAAEASAAKTTRSRLARQTTAADAAEPSAQQPAKSAAGSGRSLRSRPSMAAAAESSPPDEDSAGSDEPASTARPNADLENESEEAGAAAGGAVGGKSLEELAVRFSQATKELQVLGLLRPARKRRGDFAQKLVFHSGHADMEVESNR